MELRIRPKGDYSHTATLQELFSLAEHWNSDLLFYQDELKFLHHLLEKYFMWLIEDESMVRLQSLTSRLKEVGQELDTFGSGLNRHFQRLGGLIENPFSLDEHVIRDENQNLEDDLDDFTIAFQKIKKEVFELMEHTIKTEKGRHLLEAVHR